MDDLQQQLQSVFRDVLDQEDLVLQRSTTASDVEGWDSLMHIHLVLGIERHFKIKFKTAEIVELKNVGEMLDLIQKKLAK